MGVTAKNNIALIPARSGSKRLPQKNIKPLNGIPLIAYTIRAAQKSGIFAEIIVSTDSEEISHIARKWGAAVPKLRPRELATDESSDIEWVMHCITDMISTPLENVENISILRPTNPLRSGGSIVEALKQLNGCHWADSIRAMEPTNKHPGKMWVLDEFNHATPYIDQKSEKIPTYNRPTQSLQKLWVQNASLEIARIDSVLETESISGRHVLCLELPEFEGIDINTSKDWEFLEFLISKYPKLLPNLSS